MIDKAEKNIAADKHASEASPITGQIHSISLQNVSFGYDDHEALRDVFLQFQQGKSYAIVGESGSGKTTLLHLILSYQKNYSGVITYDDINARTVNAGIGTL